MVVLLHLIISSYLFKFFRRDTASYIPEELEIPWFRTDFFFSSYIQIWFACRFMEISFPRASDLGDYFNFKTLGDKITITKNVCWRI